MSVFRKRGGEMGLMLLGVMVAGFIGFYLWLYPKKSAWDAIRAHGEVAIYVRGAMVNSTHQEDEQGVIASARDMATELLELHGIRPYQIYNATDLAELHSVSEGEVYLFELIVFHEGRTAGGPNVALTGCLRQWPSGVELVSSRDEYFREHGSKIYQAVDCLLNQLVSEFNAAQRIASDNTSNVSVPIRT